MTRPAAPEEIIWDAKVLLPDGSQEAISIMAYSEDEAQQMLVSHYGAGVTVLSFERDKSE